MSSVPERQCISCREKHNKSDLIRVVRTADGRCRLDLAGKADGRGAYVCDKQSCIDKLVKTRAIDRAFRTHISQEVYDSIIKEYGEREK